MFLSFVLACSKPKDNHWVASSACSSKLACSKNSAKCSLSAVLVRQLSRLRKPRHEVLTNQTPLNSIIFCNLTSNSNCDDPSAFVSSLFHSPFHTSLWFLLVGKTYFLLLICSFCASQASNFSTVLSCKQWHSNV